MTHRYVFVAGLHRSGTSLIARRIASLEGVSGITGAPVPENEGAYLQGAIPHQRVHGRPDHFATDPCQHLIEGCAFDRLETRIRLEADWAPWFDETALWRVEKSPVNLTRMRLYQQLFPLSHYVILVRHPLYWIRSIAKWSDRTPEALLSYWTGAYTLAMADRERLHASLLLRYEDVVAAPERCDAALAAFLSRRSTGAGLEPIRDGNALYDPPDIALEGPTRRLCDALGYGDRGEVEAMALPLVRHHLSDVEQRTRRRFGS